mmetsp:Transcript_59331/g.153337  ORF Transcript_59331/g.153337 Transcript_59331/m.153337 type:complete len:259 (+) Transcript_59331:1671-2447(+)
MCSRRSSVRSTTPTRRRTSWSGQRTACRSRSSRPAASPSAPWPRSTTSTRCWALSCQMATTTRLADSSAASVIAYLRPESRSLRRPHRVMSASKSQSPTRGRSRRSRSTANASRPRSSSAWSSMSAAAAGATASLRGEPLGTTRRTGTGTSTRCSTSALSSSRRRTSTRWPWQPWPWVRGGKRLLPQRRRPRVLKVLPNPPTMSLAELSQSPHPRSAHQFFGCCRDLVLGGAPCATCWHRGIASLRLITHSLILAPFH